MTEQNDQNKEIQELIGLLDSERPSSIPPESSLSPYRREEEKIPKKEPEIDIHEQVSRTLAEIDQVLADLPEPPPLPLKKWQEEMFDIPIGDDTFYPYHELAKKVMETPDDRYVPSFITVIDKLVDNGFRGGELIVLSGPTKSGKTTLAQTISYLQAQQGFSAIWFTLEMSWQELTRKFMAIDENLKKGVEPTQLPLFYPIDNSQLSLFWLEKQIKKAQRENMATMVFIDHLHFLLPLQESKGNNVSFTVGAIVRELKRIAVRLNIPILLIAHTKKIDVKETPTINSIRDSSFVGQESDYAFIIWRERLGEPKRKKLRMDEYIQEKKDERKKKIVKLAERIETVTERIEDEEEWVLYTDRTFVSLETNRRNGRTRRFSLFFDEGRFWEREEYDKRLQNAS